MRIILLGAPGSGKGTQSLFLSEKLRVPSISTGDILRKACHEKTDLGKEVQSYLDKGQLVPDKVVIEIIDKRLKAADCARGYILDGFPRTVQQAEALALMLRSRETSLDLVLNLEVDDRDLLTRLTGRRQCRQCGAGYHMAFAPPLEEGICDRCGGALYQRDDDREKTIRERLNVYKKQTEPLIDFYKKEKLLRTVSGKGEAKEVFEKILEYLLEAAVLK